MIRLYKNYKYGNGYEFSKNFKTKEEQKNYFKNLDYIQVVSYEDSENEQGYIKKHEAFVIDFSYDFLVSGGINYVSYNNGFKDVYAFIVMKEYVNDEVTKIHFEIDVLQTYMFDYSIEKSFIERKKCNISEITDFDEGINVGEHSVISDKVMLEKECQYFALFSGFKEQQIIVDDDGIIKEVLNIPYPTMKPLTAVDGIPYPLYFLPLTVIADYKPLEVINLDVGGNNNSDVIKSALKRVGYPYVYGDNLSPLHEILGIGTGRGTDCSGLCQWAYYDAKVTTSLNGRWTTDTMVRYAHKCSINEINPGDVGFCTWSSGSMLDQDQWGAFPGHVFLIEKVTLRDDGGHDLHTIEALSPEHGICKRIWKYDVDKIYLGKMRF